MENCIELICREMIDMENFFKEIVFSFKDFYTKEFKKW